MTIRLHIAHEVARTLHLARDQRTAPTRAPLGDGAEHAFATEHDATTPATDDPGARHRFAGKLALITK
ncbi:MAG TPA: hypothetical protein VMV45_21030 [Casimicrobiaceae bacterium]|nr:hypothetical protein [Casimicrobiaceae bacterium]